MVNRRHWAAAAQRRLANDQQTKPVRRVDKPESYVPTEDEVSEHVTDLYRFDPDHVKEDEERDKFLKLIEDLPSAAKMVIDRHMAAGSYGVFKTEDNNTSGIKDTDA